MERNSLITPNELFNELDGFDARVPLLLLTERLSQLHIDSNEIEPFVRFASDTYRRNLMRSGRAYHALILCWAAGQRSPIHDHRGSSCGVRVIKGTCTETVFEMTDAGHVYPVRTHKLNQGHFCGSEDADIHQISNLESGPLVTLHIYSPPLLVMGKYSLTSPARTEFAEQVYSFAEGAGI